MMRAMQFHRSSRFLPSGLRGTFVRLAIRAAMMLALLTLLSPAGFA